MKMDSIKACLRPWRRRLRILLGRDLRVRPSLDCPRERHGSEHGGWWICPDGIGPESVVYSFGIGKDISFDLSLMERYGLRLEAFDPTPESLAWLEAQALPAGFSVHALGLAAKDDSMEFFPPEQDDHVSHTLLPGTYDANDSREAISVPVRRLAGIMEAAGHERIDILKMDIEGAEYAVLDDILASGLEIRQILVEFHHRFPGVGIAPTRRAVENLEAAGYRLFHVSASGEELSFLRAANEQPR